MTRGAVDRRPAFLARIQDGAEELVYRLNEREHWLFRVYDQGNELWARLAFRGVRRRAARIDTPLCSRGGIEAHFRFLTPADDDAFLDLLSSFQSRYVPPHPLDFAGARRALRRSSYLPFGIFIGDRLVGYLLLRLFFFRRAVTGIWTLPETHNLGLAQEALARSGAFTLSEGIPDYATIPVDNPNSLRVANASGWKTIRSNRRFHVTRLQPRCQGPAG